MHAPDAAIIVRGGGALHAPVRHIDPRRLDVPGRQTQVGAHCMRPYGADPLDTMVRAVHFKEDLPPGTVRIYAHHIRCVCP
jgi:hypothetical protein